MQVVFRTIKQTRPDWQDFLFCSDVHFGEESCCVDAFVKDLKEAKYRKARINIIGDLLGMILPKDIKRYQPSTVKKEHRQYNAIVNQVIDDMADILLPYADLIDVIGLGNHEISIINHHSTDTHAFLMGKLASLCERDKRPFTASHGGICGFIRYQFDVGGHRKPFVVKYHHGAGGSAPVTKGMIGLQRVKTQWLADMYVEGHDHNRIVDTDVVIGLNSSGNIEQRNTRAIKCGNYRISYPLQSQKDAGNIDYTELSHSQVKPLGGVFAKVRLVKAKAGSYFEQRVEA